jgi:hypothetical protein
LGWLITLAEGRERESALRRVGTLHGVPIFFEVILVEGIGGVIAEPLVEIAQWV